MNELREQEGEDIPTTMEELKEEPEELPAVEEEPAKTGLMARA